MKKHTSSQSDARKLTRKKRTRAIKNRRKTKGSKGGRKQKAWMTLKLIKAVFVRHLPGFSELIKELPDKRNPEKVTYSVNDLVMSGIFLFLIKAGSRNQMNLTTDDEAFKENLAELFGFKVPNCDTINRYFETLPSEAIEEVLKQIVQLLIKKKLVKVEPNFENCHLVAIDGSGDGRATENDEGTTSKTSKLGHTSYSRSFLLASLCTSAGFSIPIACEWISTEDGMSKEDCELNAFKRLTEKLKCFFPRLNICLLLDSLYPNSSVFSICESYNWHFVIGVKKNLPTVLEQAHEAIENGDKRVREKTYKVNIDGKTREQSAIWVTGITYQNYELTVIFTSERDKDGQELTFSYVSSLCPEKQTIKKFIWGVRSRWNLEDTFNTLKNRGFKGLHKYARSSFQAYKNWRIVMFIAFTIEQLVVMSKNMADVFDRSNDTFKNLWKSVIILLSDSNLEPILVPPRMKFSYFR